MADASTQNPANIPPVETEQYVTPTTGSTVNVTSARKVVLVINPAGSLLALTIAFAGSPVNGDTLQMGSTQAVTTVTMSGGTIIGGLASFVIGSSTTYRYNTTASEWVKIAS